MGGQQEPVTILRGGAVITLDAARRVLDPGAVAVRGTRIEAVGTPDELAAAHPDARTIDLGDCVLLPGLVDTHGHAGHGLTKAIADGAGDEWLELMERLYHRSTGEEFWRAESYLSALEHLEFGVTTSLSYTGSAPRVDHPRYAVAAAAGYDALGLRHIVALGPPSAGPEWRFRDPDRGEETTVDLDGALRVTGDTIDQLHGTGDGRISVFVAPSGLIAELRDGRATDFATAQLRGALDLARAKGTQLHAHAYRGQVRAAAEAVPDALGPHLSLAHCAGIDLVEVRIMAETGTGASHGPLTHAYALARFPLIEALDAGVTVAISTDGSSPDRSFDLLSQGRIAMQLQRAHFADTSLLPAGKLLEMMTIDAAKVLGLDAEIGSLEPGKRADVIALDLRTARMAPRVMIPQRVVYVGSGLDVVFTMVDGRVLRQRDDWGGIDRERILDDAQRAAEAAYAEAGALDALAQHPDTWGQVRYRS